MGIRTRNAHTKKSRLAPTLVHLQPRIRIDGTERIGHSGTGTIRIANQDLIAHIIRLPQQLTATAETVQGHILDIGTATTMTAIVTAIAIESAIGTAMEEVAATIATEIDVLKIIGHRNSRIGLMLGNEPDCNLRNNVCLISELYIKLKPVGWNQTLI